MKDTDKELEEKMWEYVKARGGRKLIRKIDEALKRIEDRNYGYCLETGEEIGVKRLEARPVATLSLEAQERRERREKQYGDRDDRYR